MTFEPFDPNAETSEFRRNLPHWQQGGSTYFATWWLADSLPHEKLKEWLADRHRWLEARGLASPDEIIKLRPGEPEEFGNQFGARLEEWLDAGHGSCCLAMPAAAEAVENVLRHFDGDRYALGEFVVMPNHVHLLVTPAPGWDLSKLEQAWKGISARQINALRNTTGPLWQHESFDHVVRSAAQLAYYENYIRENPSKAGLSKETFRSGRGTFVSVGPGAAGSTAPGFITRKIYSTGTNASREEYTQSADLGGRPIVRATLSRLKVRHFRCFEEIEAEFSPGMNFIVGPNAQGKTSLMEAACILLRLQSPRISQLARVVKHGRRGFVTDGHFAGRHLQFYYSQEKKKLSLDGVEQTNAKEWLQIARMVWFANDDIELVRGTGEKRRRFLDFIGMQLDATYRASLRAYEHALRSRNHLLRHAPPRWREIAAFDRPLIEHGGRISTARRKLVTEVQTDAEAAHFAISGSRESLQLEYVPGDQGSFAPSLASANAEDARLRQTTVGPHRDDVRFFLNTVPAEDASEGQQRTIVLALKLGAARLLERRFRSPPLLLLDDIFGELDPGRRNALLAALPVTAQQIITTTHLDWMPDADSAHVLRLGT